MTRTMNAIRRRRRLASLATLLTSTMLAGVSTASAQAQKPAASPPGAPVVQEVIVTAEKRAESIQHVALSVQAMDTKKLDQLNVTDFQDYVKFLPSVNFVTTGPSQTSVYMRGIADGEDGNHSGPLPSVGTYLDEQPITTIGGTIDVHIYDVARVEALAGPQGTLYGASSEAGTVRIITNKPTTSGFSAGVDVQGNNVANGGEGYVTEGYVNIPLASNMAVRLVGFDEHDSGFIDNVLGERTFFTSGDTIDNKSLVKNAYNPVDTYGGRAALKIDLDSNWSIMPTVIAQDTRDTGVFGFEPSVGDLQVQRFQPDSDHDRWVQAALTVTGKISKMDFTYSGGYMVRAIDSREDYTDYSVFYDGYYGSGAFWQDNNGNPLQSPQQEIVGKDRFTKQSHEIRIASPSTDRFRIIAGLFTQRQSHWIIQDYEIQGLGSQISVPGWANTIWLTDQMRIDRDNAVFGEASYDFTDHLTFTGGVRYYNYDNSLHGFFGFGQGYDALTNYTNGMGANDQNCITMSHDRGEPCEDLAKNVRGNGETHKLNLTYKFDPQRMVYFTYSTGYRPGGINRNSNFGAYGADYLTNYEIGWKTTWFNHRFRFNGAIFDDIWDGIQFSYLGPNSFTIIQNAGQAASQGVETDYSWQILQRLNLSGAATYTDARLTTPYCQNQSVVCTNQVADAPTGTPLPVTPRWKANSTLRYGFDLFGTDAHAQGSVVYTSKAVPDLLPADNFGSMADGFGGLGVMPAYTTFDFSFGMEKNGMGLELFVKNATDERGQVSRSTPCTISTCTATSSLVGASLPAPAVYAFPIMPRLIGIKLSKKF